MSFRHGNVWANGHNQIRPPTGGRLSIPHEDFHLFGEFPIAVLVMRSNSTAGGAGKYCSANFVTIAT